jgi:uncharacterized protein YecT (DUF1311 family)
VLLGLPLACGQALAQVADDPCKTQSTTLEINECARLVLAEKDKELNSAYQRVLATLVRRDKDDPTDYETARKEFVAGQRAWIQFRDNDCAAKYSLNAQGSIRTVTYLVCVTEHTEQRTRGLRLWSSQTQ